MRAQRYVFAIATLLFATASHLAAQATGPPPFTCTASTKTAPARAEGTTELSADVVVTCTGGTPFISDATVPRFDIQLTFNGVITSRILGAGGASEAFLLFDEPAPGAQYPCDQPTGVCPFIGNGTGTGYYGNGPQTFLTPNNRNVYQGLVNTNTTFTTGSPQAITWPDISIDPPGTGNTRVYRFTNIRFDATTVKGNLVLTALTFNNVNGATSITGTPLTTAIPQPSLLTAVRDAANAAAAPTGTSVPIAPVGGATTRYATLRFGATLAGADHPRTIAAFAGPDASPAPVAQNTPGTVYASESGFYNPTFGTFGPGGNLGTAGLADIGTRYMAVFSNVPAGFSIFVDQYNSTSATGPTARLVDTDGFGSGTFTPTAGNGTFAQLTVTGGTATAVWEVLRPGGTDQFDFGVYLAYPAGVTPLPFPVLVQLHYAPVPRSTAIPQFTTIGSSQTLFNFIPPPTLLVAPPSLTLTATATGPNPTPGTLNLTSSLAGFAVGYTLASTGALPLQILPASGTTPGSSTVGVNITGLTAGTYTGAVTATPTNGTASVVIPVTLNLAPPPNLLVSPTPLTFTATATGPNPASQTLNLTSSIPTIPVSYTLTSTGTVPLQILPAAGTTPGSATVSVNISGLAAGTYNGAITAKPSNGAASVVIPVTLNVAPPPNLLVSPPSLTFSGVAGGNNPGALPLNFTSSIPSIPVSYTLTSTGAFPVQLQPASGNTPGSVTAGINIAGLSSGTFSATIVATPTNGTGAVRIPVTLNLDPGPQITSVSPNPVLAGGSSFTLTVTGNYFVPGTVVQWNGGALATGFVNSGQLTASVPASLIASPGFASISASTPDGASSNSVQLTILALTLISISPSSVTAGGPGFDMTLTGTGFSSGATVNVGGSSLQPSSITNTRIVAPIPASVIAQPGTLSVSVSLSGRTSNSLSLAVVQPFRLDSISPNSVIATGPAFTLALSGVGFATGASVQVGGTSLQPVSLSNNQISVSVPASVIASPGTLSVTVTNPGPVVSNALPLTVTPAMRLTAINPDSATAGSAGFTMTLSGTNFPAGAVAQWNGQALSTTSGTSSSLTATVPAALIATQGTASISVSGSGITSNALPFTINPVPPPTITLLSPSSAVVGGAAFTMTVSGANLPSGSTVRWNGQGLGTGFVSTSQLTADVPASLIAAPGTASVSVITPAGVSSNSLPFTITLPPITGVNVSAPGAAPSGQDQPITVSIGTYPVDVVCTITLTFAGDGGLPNDPAIQFQNQTRTFTFTIPAGTQPNVPQLIFKTGTTAGVITLTTTFTAGGVDITPPNTPPQKIQVGRAAPSISSFTCTHDATTITAVIDGYTNTREAIQATFDFTAAAGATLGTSQLVATVNPIFTAYFGGSSGGDVGGVFRYTQPFTVQGSPTTIASITVKLVNSAGTSNAVTCQLQ